MTAEFELVDPDATFFAPAATDLIDGLISQYQHQRRQIAEVAAFMAGRLDTGVMEYFLDGNRSEYRGRVALEMSAQQLFAEAGAVANLNACYWSKLLHQTDVLNVMPQKRRDEWNEQILNPQGRKRDKWSQDWEIAPIPEFEETTVRQTISSLLNMRGLFLAERVDGIFQRLSKTHVTNQPEGFGKRMILAGVSSGFSVHDSMAGTINDLRAVIAKFLGRDEPTYDSTRPVISYARNHRRGEWVTVDGGALRIRCYLAGTAHLEVHPDMAWRLNSVLAKLHPLAIPAHFRERPKARKKLREFDLIQKPLPFKVLDAMARMTKAREKAGEDYRRNWIWRDIENSLCLPYDTSPEVQHEVNIVMESIGGARQTEGHWMFDYHPGDVVAEIMASGVIPDARAHQYYPTPRALAERLVEMAEIGPDDCVLEPSAGQGGLADLLPKERTWCVEVAELNCKVLEAKGHKVIKADFMQWDGRGPFDRIVMNPPFSDGRAEAHTKHAADKLSKGGRLVAILPSGMRGKDLPGLHCEWSQPMSGQFPGVSIDVVLLKATRV